MRGIAVSAGLLTASLALGVSARAPEAQAQAQAQDDVVGTEAIIVNGRIPHCRMRDGDPLDAVDVRPTTPFPRKEVIAADPRTGAMQLRPDDYPVTGPGVWQRVGANIGQFVFRVPEDGSPLCMGSRRATASGYAQLRQSFDAHPYWGRVLRFTAFVATQRVNQVRFWLIGSTSTRKFPENFVAGGNSQAKPIVRSNGWMPISYTIGPLPCTADMVGYGVMLDGGGDVWIYKPSFEVLPDDALPKGVKHRKEFLETDPSCRKSIYGAGN